MVNSPLQDDRSKALLRQRVRDYLTTGRGCELMGNSYGMLDMTICGRQESWEDSPEGWPQRGSAEAFRSNGRPISQWPRLAAGRSDDLGTAGR